MPTPTLAAMGFAVALLASGIATAQLRPAREAAFGSDPSGTPTSVTLRFRVGAIVNARKGPVRDVRAMVAVPIECDEQSVRLINQEFTKHVAGVEFRDLAGGGARQMLVTIPQLPNGEEARALVTYEVTTRTTPPPDDGTIARLRIPKRVPRGLRNYVGVSPFIEAKSPAIKRLARSIDERVEQELGNDTTDWDRVGAIYDHVMDEIAYLEGPDTSALDTLEEGTADCHGRSALFVALCRASGVPARMVWVHNHCYPEFYLERDADDDDSDRRRRRRDADGLWLPAESAGTRAFGEMPVARTILQKGDDFRVPERPNDRLRYASDYLTGRPAKKGGGKPSVRYVREVLQ